MKITQLCYTSKRKERDYTLLDDLREILIKSRKYNEEHNICGVLYYAHGHYFQCIQGEYGSVMRLFHKIINDNRHIEIKLIQHKSIEKKTFSKWSMKYVKEGTELSNFFTKADMHCFRPHDVSENKIDEFLNIILYHSELKKENNKHGFMNRGYTGYF